MSRSNINGAVRPACRSGLYPARLCRAVYLLLLMMLSAIAAIAQQPSPRYVLYTQNGSFLNEYEYAFDIRIDRLGSPQLELATLQLIFTIASDSAASFSTFVIDTGSSELDGSQRPVNGKLSFSGNELRIAPASPPGSGNGSIIPLHPGLRVGRFRIVSLAAMDTTLFRLQWKNGGSNPFTKLNAYVGGTNTVITDTTGHLNFPTGGPALLVPEQGALARPLPVTMLWRSCPGSVSYEFQLATDSLFSAGSVFDSLTHDTSLGMNNLVHGTPYYWRVRGISAYGKTFWSEERAFATLVASPEAVRLIAPVNVGNQSRDSVQFSWHPTLIEADRYWLECASDSLFTQNRFVDSVLVDTTYVLRNIVTPGQLWWRVRGHNAGGWGSFGGSAYVGFILGGVSETGLMPREFGLHQNYPNPFNPSTNIRYDVPRSSHVSIRLYSQLGTLVETLVDRVEEAGYYSVTLDASRFAGGVYYCSMTATPVNGAGDRYTAVRKILFLK